LGQFDAVVSGRHPPDLNRFLNRTSAKCTILQIIFYGPLEAFAPSKNFQASPHSLRFDY